MKALKLTQYDFNNMEDDNPYEQKELGVFVDEPPKTVYSKVEDYLKTITITPYIGYDKQVYPKFKVEQLELK